MFIAMTLDMQYYTDRLLTRYNHNLPEGEHELKRFFGPGCLGGMAAHLVNRITLVGHASTTHFGSHPDYGNGDFAGYKPKELANAIVNEARLPNNPGMIIDLVGCETGLSFFGQPNYAEKFAKVMAEDYGYNVYVRSFSSEVFAQHLPAESKIAKMLVTSEHDPPGIVRIIGIPVSQADRYDQQNEEVERLEKEAKKIDEQMADLTSKWSDEFIVDEQYNKLMAELRNKLMRVMHDKVSAKTAVEEMENESVLFTSYEQENNKDLSVRDAIDAVGKSYHFPPLHRDFDATAFGQLETSVYIPTSDELAPDSDCTVANSGGANEASSLKTSDSQISTEVPWEKKRSGYSSRSDERLISLTSNKKKKSEEEKSNTANSQLNYLSQAKGKK